MLGNLTVLIAFTQVMLSVGLKLPWFCAFPSLLLLSTLEIYYLKLTSFFYNSNIDLKQFKVISSTMYRVISPMRHKCLLIMLVVVCFSGFTVLIIVNL